jgi:ribosomal protein S27E
VLAQSTLALAPAYHRHRPEQTALYSIVTEHYPRFVQEIERAGGYLPGFVRQEFEDYLKCGLLEHGFLRVKCDGCRHEHLVAFSCKRRGFCPSCGARRMVESAAHLVDHVFPEAPVRQFVLTFPFPLRFLLAAQPEALTEVLAVVQRGISTFIVRHAGFTVSSGARTGAVTLIQRFGSALNLNVHLHMLFLDGAYTFRERGADFHRARRPGNARLGQLLETLSRRIVRLLERRGLLIADPECCPALDFEAGSSLDQLQAASVHYRIAIGPHAGRKALTLYSVPPLEGRSNSPLLAKEAGFSLHAATVCEAYQRRLRRHGGLRACSQEAMPVCRSARAAAWNACAVTSPVRRQGELMRSIKRGCPGALPPNGSRWIPGGGWCTSTSNRSGTGRPTSSWSHSISLPGWPPWCPGPGLTLPDFTGYSRRTSNTGPGSCRNERGPGWMPTSHKHRCRGCSA